MHNTVRYVGRSEELYIFTGTKRTLSFNLNIPCFNKKEIMEKHRALGQLLATTAGMYKDGLLSGVVLKFNLGNYFIGEPIIINSISWALPEDATWDIDTDVRLSMIIKASFTITLLNKELPQYVSEQGYFKYLPDIHTSFLSGSREATAQTFSDEYFYNANYTSALRRGNRVEKLGISRGSVVTTVPRTKIEDPTKKEANVPKGLNPKPINFNPS